MSIHSEAILERLRASDTVRVIDALAVYKDAAGELEVEHLSNLTEEDTGDAEADRRADRAPELDGLGSSARSTWWRWA